jgi:hypothetical protein
MESEKQQKVQRITNYLYVNIAEETKRVAEMTDELHDILVHRDRNPNPEIRIPFLQKLIEEQLIYIEQAIRDLKTLNSGGSLI